MSSLSAYQDLMTALATRRSDQAAAEDERVIQAALSKHDCEDEQRRILRAAQRIVMGEDL